MPKVQIVKYILGVTKFSKQKTQFAIIIKNPKIVGCFIFNFYLLVLFLVGINAGVSVVCDLYNRPMKM